MSIETSDGHPSMDYHEHVRTYHGFLIACKYSIIAMVVLLVLMAVFLV